MPNPTPGPRDLRIWWIIWGATLLSLGAIVLIVGRIAPAPAAGHQSLAQLAGIVPLFISIIIRWLVIPRFEPVTRAFPMFVLGIALAEACGLLGLFLGGPYRASLEVLGFLGIGQYLPLFARYAPDPKGTGYIPNN